MAKSPILSLSRQADDEVSLESKEVGDISMSLTFSLKNGDVIKRDLRTYLYFECNPDNGLATPSRSEQIWKIYRHLLLSEKADASKYNQLKTLKRYLVLCDRNQLDPFERDGIEGILGMQGELARQEKLANEPMPFIFDYPHNTELGIKSSSADSFSRIIKQLLVAAGCSTSIIKKYARRPNLPVDEETTKPHSDKELEVILARVQPYFYSIAQKISEYFDKYGEIPQRLEGVNIGVSRYEGDLEEKSIDLGSRVDDTHNTSILPFNQMMVSAYLLFCYYTSFNDTQIRDIRHPLRVQTSREAGKTEQYVKVQAFKGRKGSDVKAYFTGIVSGELEEAEATDKAPGYVVANVLKRGKHKHTDGLTFIKTFSEISNKCSHEQYEKLFYSVDSKGNLKKFDLDRLLDQLTFNLGLLAEDRAATSNYLSDVVCRYLNNGVWEKFSVRVDATGFRTVSRELITQEMKSTRVHSLIYAFVRSLTDIPLKGALIPLVYNDKVKRGLLEVQIKYVDGSTNSFLTPKRYLKTLKKIEERAELFNPLTKRSRGREITRPAYFLPMGVRSETYQWRGHEMPIRRNLLTDVGIPHGAYLLATGSRRLRAKNSDDLYTDADKGKQARDILQHSRKTQNKRYVNGHPRENMRQVSQGLGVLGHIAGGDAVKTAKSKVKDGLKITVLAYDEWKQKKMPSNPNGITCNGKIDLKEGKNEHYAAQKFALEKGIISEGEDITCYQYDLCIFCKSLQLIDDAHSVYKLLSFIDSLHDPIEQIPERAEYLIKRVERYESLLDLLPEETLNKADQLFEEHGRYFLFK